MALPIALINSYSLQWLRKEIDDYRGRIINLFIFPGTESGAGPNLGVLTFARTVNIIRKEIGEMQAPLSRTGWNSLRDNELINNLSLLESKVQDLQSLTVKLDNGEVVDYLSTKNILGERIESKNQVKLYLLLSLLTLGALLLHLIWRANPVFWQNDGSYILIILVVLMVSFLKTLQDHT